MDSEILSNVFDFLAPYVQSYLSGCISVGFAFGLALATILNFLGYGIFKALSLLNIK